MAEAVMRANSSVQLAVCALDDDKAGVAATGQLTLSSPATSSGQVRLQVGDKTLAVAVKAGQTADDLLQSLHEVMGAEADLPVSATLDSPAGKGTTLNLTAKNKGACVNEIGLSLTITASGVSGVLSPMAGGQGDPDVTLALTAIYSAGHTLIVVPYSTKDALNALSEHLEGVSGPTEQRGAVGVTGTTLTTAANAARITCGWHPGSVLSNGILASVYAAIIAAEDAPSEPLDNTVLTGLDVTAQTRWPMRTEMEKALHNGLSPFNVVNNKVQLVRAISTYVKNSQGIDDPTLLDINTIRTLDCIRKVWRTRMSQRFPNGGKLTDRRLLQIRSETLDVLYALQALEMVDNIDTYKDQVTVTRNKQDNTRADTTIPAPVVRGLHILTGTIYLY
ncbi:phage tail protein [Pantoea sp. Eser]|nr:phage tail protein [Pantoea sp. Eser]